jgi:hypothetical protein
MTKKRKREIIYEACERLETGVSKWSCCALWDSGIPVSFDNEVTLVDDYKEFYSSKPTIANFESGKSPTKHSQNHRIMALLFFAEAGL